MVKRRTDRQAAVPRPTRREFLASSAVLLGASSEPADGSERVHWAETPARPSARPPESFRYDPWLEVDAAALAHNVREVSRVCGGRPILAVVKNNAYGLGVELVGPVLDRLDEVGGLAVVKGEQALALRSAGVKKPILLMGLADEEQGVELVRHGVELAPFDDAAPARLAAIARRAGRRVPVHLYIDTGMSRLGMLHGRAGPWIERLADTAGVLIRSMFSAFVEEEDFDRVQLERFTALARRVRQSGIDPGALHIASSHGVFFRPDAHLDAVRPGLVLYGAYPDGAQRLEVADLRPAFSLKCRVVRVERLEPGEGVSYGRNYVAERPTWIATLPVGHADGYPRRAVDGCEVLVGGRPYQVVGAVSASHAVLELGAEPTVQVGDEATLIGAGHPALHPNAVAGRAGISVYDVLMHLSSALPKRLR